MPRPAGTRPAGFRLILVALIAAVVGSLALAVAPALSAPAPPASQPAAEPPVPPGTPAATAPEATTPEATPAPPAPPASQPAPEVKPIRLGMRGSLVKGLQRELRKHGVRLRVDGVFGRVTRAAVKRMQMKLGLKATGVADRALQERLGLVEPEPEPAAAPPAEAAPAAAEGVDPAVAAATAAAPAETAPAATAPGAEGEALAAPAEEPPGRADVVEFARTLLGIPYASAGSDPSGFDCSGFVLYVWNTFGVEMPRSADEQFGAFPKVPRDQLQPGDLVFFNGLGHDGIYIGKGRFIHSSKPGDVVKISRLDGDWYADRYEGAVRPE
jgi:cell wall-associated NlpC family hydrolase